MPPHHSGPGPGTGPGTGYGEPPGQSRREGDHPESPAGQPATQFGRRPAHAIPPPLPRPPQLRRPQPWPLQQPHKAAAVKDTRYQRLPDDDLAARAPIPATPVPPRHRSPGSAIVYASLGFLAGIVFWHAVGFWTLVHQAVFSGPRLEARAEPAVPVITAQPVVAFDEDKLRDSATRPSAEAHWQRGQNITTGSIGRPRPASTNATQAALPRPAPIVDRKTSPPVMTGPGGISWQPAVSRGP